MPLEVSQEIRTWLQTRGLGGYLRVIDAPPHPDAQEMALQIHPDTVTNNIIRIALDLQRGGEHDVEVPPHTILKYYFGLYSVSGKAYRTYGGPNKFFGEISDIDGICLCAYCESVFRIEGIEVYKNIKYGAFTSGGQEHELRSQG